MKPYVNSMKGVVEIVPEKRLPKRLRKLHSKKKKEARRKKRKADRDDLRFEWREVLN